MMLFLSVVVLALFFWFDILHTHYQNNSTIQDIVKSLYHMEFSHLMKYLLICGFMAINLIGDFIGDFQEYHAADYIEDLQNSKNAAVRKAEARAAKYKEQFINCRDFDICRDFEAEKNAPKAEENAEKANESTAENANIAPEMSPELADALIETFDAPAENDPIKEEIVPCNGRCDDQNRSLPPL